MDKKQKQQIDAILEDQAVISTITRNNIMLITNEMTERKLQHAEEMELLQTMAGIMGASSAMITSLAGLSAAASASGQVFRALADQVPVDAGEMDKDDEGGEDDLEGTGEDMPEETTEEEKPKRKRKSRAKKKDPEPLPPLGEDGPADADDDGFGFTVTDETEDGVDDEFGFEADPEEPKKEAKAEAKVEKPAEPEFTLEIVRSKLAALCQVGLQPQVKQLITDAGAERITEVAPEKYAGIMEKAKELDTKAKAGKGVS